MYNMVPKPRQKSNKGEELMVEDSGEYEWYREIDVDSNKFPPAKDMQVGKEYTLTVTVKPCRISVDKKGKTTVCLEIQEMGVSDKKEPKTKEKIITDMVDEMYPKKK